ncbi:MAG: transposase [Trueperaceae bacterium]|nr:transposase [Trueperaceae bacterium]
MPKAPPPYPPEFKEEAVRHHRSSGKSTSQVAAHLGVAHETLRSWLRRHEIDDGNAPGITSTEREELRTLRRGIRVLREEREILRKAAVDSVRQCNMFQEVLRGEDGSAGVARRAEAGAVGSLACWGVDQPDLGSVSETAGAGVHDPAALRWHRSSVTQAPPGVLVAG